MQDASGTEIPKKKVYALIKTKTFSIINLYFYFSIYTLSERNLTIKKLIALLLALAMVLSLSACGGNSAQSEPTETTAPLLAEQAVAEPATEPAAEEPAAETMPAATEVPETEAVDYTGFYEESMDDVTYQVPESWRKEDYSNEFIKEYVYYLDETNENSVMVMMLYPGNVLYTWQQAEDYMDLFASEFFSSQNGYTAEGTFSTHEAKVPARHGYCTSNGCEIEVYCFLPTIEAVFILSKWHVSDSSSEIDDDTFLKIVNSVQLPELNVEDKPEKNTGSSSSSSSSGFSNKYGTANTTCAVSGCNRSIASSGDTNCCASHSNKCGNCGCYIDGDAMFCMSCISSSFEENSKSSSSSGKKSDSSSSSKSGSDSDYDYDKGFGYSAPKPGQSFSDYVKEQDPELYNSLFQ